MYVLFFKPVTRLIEAREEHIQGSTKDAEHANQKSSEVLNTYLSKIETARKQEIERMVEARRTYSGAEDFGVSGFRRKLRSILAGLVLWVIALGVGTGSAAETAGEVAPHFDLLKQLVSFFNFAIIVVVLVVFLRKPLKTMLENRRHGLQGFA